VYQSPKINGMSMEYQTIPGNTPSKSKSYKVVNIKGHASLAKTTALKEYENKFYIQCDKYRNADITSYYELHLKVFYPSERSDLDNSLKIILDCLQKVKAIRNDNKCVKIVAGKYPDKERPRIEFLINQIK
jgi:Holliday junction resolvase RusA-like endonuclease